MKNYIGIVIDKYKNIPKSGKLTIWIMFSLIVQKAINIISTPIFTRMMSTSEFGEYSVYISWREIFIIVTSFRLSSGVYNKGLSKYNNNKDEFCLSMQYTTSILTVVMFCLYLCFKEFFNNLTGLSTFVTCLMFAELFMAMSMPLWSVRQQYDFNYKEVAIATILYALISQLVGVIFVYLASNKGLMRIFSAAMVQIIFGSIFYIINMKNGKMRYNLKYAKFGVLFNLPLIPHYFSEYILNQSDRIMIQKLVGYSAAGIYSVANSAAMVLTIISSSINQALVPWMYRKLEVKNYSDIRNTIVTISVIMLIPIGIFMALSPEIVKVLAGYKYSDAVQVMAPITASVFFIFLYTLFANIEFFYEKNKFTMYISMIGAILNIVLNYVFIKLIGYWAAGFTTFLCYGIYCLGHFMFMQKIFYESEGEYLFRHKDIGLLVILVTFIMVFFYLLNGYALLRYFCVIVLCITIVTKKKLIITILLNIKN